MPTQTSNPKLYRELSAPFESARAAEAAIEAFITEMEASRVKHRIADVVTVIQVSYLDEAGEEGVVSMSMGFGDPLKKPSMLALALGREQQKFNSAIAKVAAGKRD